MKLVKPTDEQLNTAFAEHVAEWTYLTDNAPRGYGWYVGDAKVIDADGSDMGLLRPLRFTQSADAVLPWLEKHEEGYGAFRGDSDSTRITIYDMGFGTWTHEDKSFPRAAVIALLRAHGVEVET